MGPVDSPVAKRLPGGLHDGVSVAPRVGVLGRYGERDGSSVLEAAPFAMAAPQTALVGDRRTGRAAQSLGCKLMDSGGTGFVESATAHSMTKNGIR